MAGSCRGRSDLFDTRFSIHIIIKFRFVVVDTLTSPRLKKKYELFEIEILLKFLYV